MSDEKKSMIKQALTGLRATLLLTVITGVLFPAILYAAGQALFPEQANGSLIRRADGTVIGSKLIGQSFADPKYFHPRPSAAGSGYAGESSSGTNLGPTTGKLINGDKDFSGIKQLALQYRQENGLADDVALPEDALTRSGSGLDPHISPINAALQSARVVKTRHLDAGVVAQLVAQHTEPRELGVFGEPRVNVLLLNIALDQVHEEKP